MRKKDELEAVKSLLSGIERDIFLIKTMVNTWSEPKEN